MKRVSVRPLRLAPPLPPRPERGDGVLASIRHAWNGLVHTVVHGRNMRIHLVAAVLVGLVGSGIPLGLAEKVTLIFCVLFVFFAEILNSALEHVVDLATEQVHEKARVAKDAAAAGVAVLAAGTVVVFAALLVHNWETVVTYRAHVQRQVLLGVPLAACTGLLASPWRRGPLVDAGLTLSSGALLVALFQHTQSVVFTVLTAGLVTVAVAASHTRRRGGASAK